MNNRNRGFFLRKMMLIIVVQLFVSMACTMTLLAKESTGQQVLDRTFSVKAENMELRRVLDMVREQTRVRFIFSSKAIRVDRPVTIDFLNQRLSTFLGEYMKSVGIGYKLVKDQVLLFASNPDTVAVVGRFVGGSLITEMRAASTITGTVRDFSGVPLAGASIVVKGNTLVGTTTDNGGNFTLNVETLPVTLRISYTGFDTQEVTVSSPGEAVAVVLLMSTASTINDVVVVGYGTQRRGDVTGSVVRITTDKTADLPNYNVLQSIQGRAPGINITTPDRPGENPKVSIRGINSISASTNPLLVLDGVIFNGSLNEINANDIASVDILKDASAAAVYGSRAANGVLLITTKMGKTGRPQFNFNTYYGTQSPNRLVKVLDGPGYLQKVLDFRQATALSSDPSQIDSYLTVAEANNKKNGATTDWMRKVIQPSTMNNYNLSVSGKNEQTNYYVSGTYFKQNGIVINDNFSRLTLNMNLSNKIKDWYTVSVKSMFSAQDFSGREASLTDAYRQSPYGSFLDPNGPGGFALLPVGDPLGLHPLVNTLIANKDKRNSLWGMVSSNMDMPFLPGLKWTSNFSANLRENRFYEYQDKASSPAGATAGGIATKNNTQFIDWIFDNYINYKQKFGRHSVDATLLYSREYNQIDQSSQIGRNFFTEVNGYNNMSLAGVQLVSSNFETQNAAAYMGRLNYGFDNRFALTLTARRDGYSGFSEGNKFATFPSLAMAWTLTNERFMAQVKGLDNLKLRLSYGMNGNQAVGRYQSLARMASGNYVFGAQSVTSIFVNTMANNSLTWETTTSRNLGVDFSLMGWRLNGTVDLYSSVTSDILLRRALPQTSGFSDIFTNVGQVSNRGVEVSLNSVNIKENKGGLSWESGIVFSLNRNKIDKLTGADSDKDGREDDDIRNSWFIGQPLGSYFGYKTSGVYQLNEPGMMTGFRAGDYRLTDVDKDGKISPTDRVILGNNLPNYSFSISNTIRFKELSLYVLIQSIQGGSGYYMGNNLETRSPNAPFTTFTERFNIQDVPYWTPARPSEDYPRINYNPSFPHPFLEDRSFVRLQDLSLSYSLHKNLLKRLRVDGARVHLSAKNMLTLTRWMGYDPENATTIQDFPLMRSLVVGLDFKF